MTMLVPLAYRWGNRARREGRHREFLWLHARARAVPMFVAGVAVVALLGWIAADWLVHRPWSTGPDARSSVVTAAPLLAVVIASLGLGGRDEELERSMAVPWWRFRFGYVVVVVVVIGAALALTGLWKPQFYGAFELVRNTFGFAGITVVAAVILGTRLAWIPAFGYVAVVSVVAPRPLTDDSAWWTWPLQPWAADPATWAAAVLFVAGLALYIATGARPSRDAEE